MASQKWLSVYLFLANALNIAAEKYKIKDPRRLTACLLAGIITLLRSLQTAKSHGLNILGKNGAHLSLEDPFLDLKAFCTLSGERKYTLAKYR